MNIQNLFPGQLLQSKPRIQSSNKTYKHRLDKNEQSDDLPEWLKLQVLQQTMHLEWNRYPDHDHSDIEKRIAEANRLQGNQVLLGSGSASFITSLLNYFGMQRRQIVITQPSYSLFDYHCRTYGISYTPWMLNEALEYDESLLPELEKGAVLFVVSPNNPVGNTIPQAMLEGILQNNPEALIILDAVYAEFGGENLTAMVNRYSNLLILRSLSKELPVAALRLGYLCGNTEIISCIRTLMLPFTINPLGIAFARNMQFQQECTEWGTETRKQIMEERARMYDCLQSSYPASLQVYRSGGNFLLIRIQNEKLFQKVMSAFDEAGIKVLNTSAMPLLENTFRITIGNYAQNCEVLDCLQSVVSDKRLMVSP